MWETMRKAFAGPILTLNERMRFARSPKTSGTSCRSAASPCWTEMTHKQTISKEVYKIQKLQIYTLAMPTWLVTVSSSANSYELKYSQENKILFLLEYLVCRPPYYLARSRSSSAWHYIWKWKKARISGMKSVRVDALIRFDISPSWAQSLSQILRRRSQPEHCGQPELLLNRPLEAQIGNKFWKGKQMENNEKLKVDG